MRDLARLAQVSAATINRFEQGQLKCNPSTLAALKRTLEAGGCIFTERGVDLAERPEGPG